MSHGGGGGDGVLCACVCVCVCMCVVSLLCTAILTFLHIIG